MGAFSEHESRGPAAVGVRHRWFAWFPVHTDVGRVWLRVVVRQRWERSVGYDRSKGVGGLEWCRRGYWRYGTVERFSVE